MSDLRCPELVCCIYTVPGAADDASHVATMLEVARALVSVNAKPLAAPVTFLFTGGEETLSQVPGQPGDIFLVFLFVFA